VLFFWFRPRNVVVRDFYNSLSNAGFVLELTEGMSKDAVFSFSGPVDVVTEVV